MSFHETSCGRPRSSFVHEQTPIFQCLSRDVLVDLPSGSDHMYEPQSPPQRDRSSSASEVSLLYTPNEDAATVGLGQRTCSISAENQMLELTMGSIPLQDTCSSNVPIMGNTIATSPAIASQDISTISYEGVNGVAETIRCFDHGCDGRKFSTRGNYVRHLREKSGVSKCYTCPHCGMKFTRSTAKAKHVNSLRCRLWMLDTLVSNYATKQNWVDNQLLELGAVTWTWPLQSINTIAYPCVQQAVSTL